MGIFKIIEGMIQARLMGKTSGGSQVQVQVDNDGVLQVSYAPHALVGASHEASNLTIGHFLRATAAAAFAFQAIQSEDLPKPIDLERANTSDLILTGKVTGDAHNRIEMYADGTIKLGRGTEEPSMTLQYTSDKAWQLSRSILFSRQYSSDTAFYAKRDSDTEKRWRVDVSGRQEWGLGGISARDAFFERLAAGLLGHTSTKIWTPDRKGLAHGRFERKDADTGRLTGLAGTSKLIEVGGDYTSLASDIERALTAGNYLLNADGSISTSNPAADTNYHAYLLGPGHSTNPNELRYSATTPNSDGYLGGSGDAAHCRHVGWIRTDASTQFADDGCVHSFVNPIPYRTTVIGTGTTQNITASAGEVDIDSPQPYILIPPGWVVLGVISTDYYHSVVGSACQFRVSINSDLAPDTNNMNYLVAGYNQSLVFHHTYKAGSLAWGAVKGRAKTSADTLTVRKNRTIISILIVPGG